MGIATSYPIPTPDFEDSANKSTTGHKISFNLQKHKLSPITYTSDDEGLYDNEVSEEISNIKSNSEKLESKLDLKIKELDLKIKELDLKIKELDLKIKELDLKIKELEH
ncbi:hypothetical protein NMY3_03201 [Candidatus Nitrosocosmicus oleophilus]|uniref:Uncharacterized protein n=1 Tax=Candidatus Nitrosocosmicus oleophilus TaxID=1353260 RepID=A0A654M411_9ARCH|nr:hypothetical protein [Candidatus Nitrosocosmicus oleophilus]ALI37386.1 hypothetical protein NMY3_03201 [Candidatus Nitrosocosmicus oleophilus]